MRSRQLRQGGTLKLHVLVRPGDAEDARPASVAYARGIYLGSESLHTTRDSLKDGHDFGVAKVQVDDDVSATVASTVS